MICVNSVAADNYAEQMGILDELDIAREQFIDRRAAELRHQAITKGHVRINGEIFDVGEILGGLEHQTNMQVYTAVYAALNGNMAAIQAAYQEELTTWCERAAGKEWQRDIKNNPGHDYD